MTKRKTAEQAEVRSVPEVLKCPVPLHDVQQQTGLFQDLPAGRYIIEYNQGNGVFLPLPVYWTGSDLVA